MRVVSLVPAATEIVAALGASKRLVGISHECDYPPEVLTLPRVTRLRVDPALSSGDIDRVMAEAKRTGVTPIEVDVELIARLRPDVVIGQATCALCAAAAPDLARIADTLMPTPWIVTLHAHTLDGVFADIGRVGEAVELTDEADELIAGLRYRLRRVRRATERGSRRAESQDAAPQQHAREPPRVLVLEWIDPPYVAGHWVPELVEIAGGRDVGNTPGARSASRSWQELCALAPDVVVVALCGCAVPRARQDVAAVTDRDARALLARRVEFLDGNAYTSRPGPRLVDAAELLARLLHD